MILKRFFSTIEFIKSVPVLISLTLVACIALMQVLNQAIFTKPIEPSGFSFMSGFLSGLIFLCPIVSFSLVGVRKIGSNIVFSAIFRTVLSFSSIVVFVCVVLFTVFVVVTLVVPNFLWDIPLLLERTEFSFVLFCLTNYFAIRLSYGLPLVLKGEKGTFQLREFWKSSSKSAVLIAFLSAFIAVVSEVIPLFFDDSVLAFSINTAWITVYSLFIGAFTGSSVCENELRPNIET